MSENECAAIVILVSVVVQLLILIFRFVTTLGEHRSQLGKVRPSYIPPPPRAKKKESE